MPSRPGSRMAGDTTVRSQVWGVLYRRHGSAPSARRSLARSLEPLWNVALEEGSRCRLWLVSRSGGLLRVGRRVRLLAAYAAAVLVAPAFAPVFAEAQTPSCTDNWAGGSCSGSVTYSQSTTLDSSILVSGDVTIDPGITLTTDGNSIIVGQTFTNEGTVDGGHGTLPITKVPSFPHSYGGSGGGEAWGPNGESCSGGEPGGSTLAPGGSTGGGDGSTPAPPSSLSSATIGGWYTSDMGEYLNGGGSGADNGNGGYLLGPNAYGLYIQAQRLVAGTLDTSGQPSTVSDGGSGGGAILLAYGAGGLVAGAYTVAGGAGGTNGIAHCVGGTGGAGQVITFDFGDSPPVSGGAPPSASPPHNTSPPTVIGGVMGALHVGDRPQCQPGGWSGTQPIKYSYQWLRDGVWIFGATAATYAVQEADEGHNVVCQVTATNAGGSTAAQSAPMAVPVENRLAGVRNLIDLENVSVLKDWDPASNPASGCDSPSGMSFQAGARDCYAVEQNFQLSSPAALPDDLYWVQNAVELSTGLFGGTWATGIYEIWRYGASSPTYSHSSGSVEVSYPTTVDITSQLHGSQLRLSSTVGGSSLLSTPTLPVEPLPSDAFIGDARYGSAVPGQPLPQLAIVGPAEPQTATFGPTTSGSIESLIQPRGGTWSTSVSEEGETVSGLGEYAEGLNWMPTGGKTVMGNTACFSWGSRGKDQDIAFGSPAALGGSSTLNCGALGNESSTTVSYIGTATITLSCASTAPCSGTATLTAATGSAHASAANAKSIKRRKRKRLTRRTIGTAKFFIPPGKTATMKIKLNTAGRALLKAHHGKLNAVLTIHERAPKCTRHERVHLAQTP